jgi:tetratricopeptide (TPR) repeat protein
MMRFAEFFQSRSIALAGVVIILLSLSPTPINRKTDQQLLRAQTAARSGELSVALSHLEDVIRFYPDHQRYRITAGEIAYATGEYRKAIQHLKSIEPSAKNDVGFNCLLADLNLQVNDLEHALEYWKAANQGCTVFEQALFVIVDEEISKGSLTAAEHLLQELSQANPLDPDLHLRLGMLQATYDPEKALASIRLADDLSENSTPQAQQLFRIIEDARAEDQPAYTLASVGQYFASIDQWIFARYALEAAIKIQPDYADAYAFLGLAKDQIGENGIRELLKAVELAPEAVIPHLYLGMHWQLKNELDMAFNEFERAAELDPTNPAIAAQIGAVYEAKGDIMTAIQAYRAAAELDPQNPDFWLLLALVSLENEIQVREIALPAARNAVTLDPESPAALDALGYCHYLLEDLIYAETYIRRSIEIDPNSALSQYHFGLLKLIQEETAIAIAAFKTAYKIDPDGPIGMRAKRALDSISH